MIRGDSKEEDHFSSESKLSDWLGIIDPVGTPIQNPVVFRDSCFEPFTYDRKSVKAAVDRGELVEFGINQTNFEDRIMRRFLVQELINFITLDQKEEKFELEQLYDSPDYLEWPAKGELFLCIGDGHSYPQASVDWMLENNRAMGTNKAITIHQISKDPIAERIRDFFYKEPNISAKKFQEKLKQAFNNWFEDDQKIRKTSYYNQKIISLLLLLVVTTRKIVEGYYWEKSFQFLFKEWVIILEEYLVLQTSYQVFFQKYAALPKITGFQNKWPFFMSIFIRIFLRPVFFFRESDLFFLICFFQVAYLPFLVVIWKLSTKLKIMEDFITICRRKSVWGLAAYGVSGFYVMSLFAGFMQDIEHIARFGSIPFARIYFHCVLFLNELALAPGNMLSLSMIIKKIVPDTAVQVAQPRRQSSLLGRWTIVLHIFVAILAGIVIIFNSFYNESRPHSRTEQGLFFWVTAFGLAINQILFGLTGVAMHGQISEPASRYRLFSESKLGSRQNEKKEIELTSISVIQGESVPESSYRLSTYGRGRRAAAGQGF